MECGHLSENVLHHFGCRKSRVSRATRNDYRTRAIMYSLVFSLHQSRLQPNFRFESLCPEWVSMVIWQQTEWLGEICATIARSHIPNENTSVDRIEWMCESICQVKKWKEQQRENECKDREHINGDNNDDSFGVGERWRQPDQTNSFRATH